MPKILNNTEALTTVSNFGFSAQRPDTLGASEYTLASITIDESPSVAPFKADLEKAYRTVIEACRKNPRADNLLVRASGFSSRLREAHGFVTLDNINEKDFQVDLSGGGTALWDATMESVEVVDKYSQQLDGMDFLVNAVCFIITDGEENSSRVANPDKIKDAIVRIKRAEKLESLKTVLIGVGSGVQSYLDAFAKDAAIDQVVGVDTIDAKSLAKIAAFVSKSISSSSQSLGTGGPSQNLTI